MASNDQTTEQSSSHINWAPIYRFFRRLFCCPEIRAEDVSPVEILMWRRCAAQNVQSQSRPSPAVQAQTPLFTRCSHAPLGYVNAPRENENDEKAVVTSTASTTEIFCPLFPAISSSVSPHIGVKVLPTLPNQITPSGEEKDEKAKKEKESLSLKEKVAKIQMEEHFEQLKEIYGYIEPDSNKLSVYD